MAASKSDDQGGLILPDLTPRDEADYMQEDTESLASSTTSVTSSIYDYRKLHGRLYAPSHEYWAPVDGAQNEAFDILHNVHLMIAGDRLFLSPIEIDPAKKPTLEIADVATGSGVWALDVASALPHANVTGTDIVATQPSWVPPNCKFVIEDVTAEWTLPTNFYDLVHIRALYGSVADYDALYKQVFERVKPGGYFEHVEREVRIESDHTRFGPDHVFNQWAELSYAAGDKFGRTFRIAQGHTMKEHMERAGFEDVHERKIKMPLHGWPKNQKLREAGYMAQLGLDQALDGLGLFTLTQVHGWSEAEAVALIGQVRKETRKLSNFSWCLTTVVYGRKPAKAA